MFEPRKIEEERRLTGGQRAVVIVMNVMLLAELTWAIYHGQQDPQNLTAVFLRTFIPAAAITLVVARILLRRLKAVVPGAADNSP